MILVATDASAIVCYITRFTEENFATLIAFIFIAKAVENVIKIGDKYPIDRHGKSLEPCICIPPFISDSSPLNWTTINAVECIVSCVMKIRGHFVDQILGFICRSTMGR